MVCFKKSLILNNCVKFGSFGNNWWNCEIVKLWILYNSWVHGKETVFSRVKSKAKEEQKEEKQKPQKIEEQKLHRTRQIAIGNRRPLLTISRHQFGKEIIDSCSNSYFRHYLFC